MVYVGEGLPPIPRSLVDKILAWKFVEMSEMLPEYWALAKEDNDPKKEKSKRPKVTDFHTWLQCFAMYAGVLGKHHPSAIPELMAYMVTISQASQDFDGLAWVRYDAAYRRWAAASGNRNWSSVNPSVYAICFTGRASMKTRCDLCLKTGHLTRNCKLEVDEDPDLPVRVKAVESVVLSLAKDPKRESFGESSKESTEICRLYNNNACRYRRCRYRHACLNCGGKHPAAKCDEMGAQQQSAPLGAPASRQSRRDNTRPY